MAAAVIQGLLAGLGNTGEQLGESRLLNEEQTRRRQAATVALQEQQERIADQRQQRQLRVQTAKQAQIVGQPFTSGGKVYAHFQDPSTGAINTQEIKSPVPETTEESFSRGWKALGFSDEEIKQA